MTISVLDNSLKNRMDAANPNSTADAFRIVKLGSVLRAVKTHLRKKTPAANTGNLATLQAVTLPDDAKAVSIIRAYARAGTGTPGELTVVAAHTTPAAGQCAVAPNGNLVFLAADVYTGVDVVYEPEKYDLYEGTFTVASNAIALPALLTTPGVVILLEAEVLTGTATGNKIILAPGGSPAAGQAALNTAKTSVSFAAADAATKARLKVAISAAVDIDALLTAASSVA